MSVFDVRNQEQDVIESIVFSDSKLEVTGCTIVAYKIQQRELGDGINIHDKEEFVIIRNKEHAFNLMKALDKSIELGWLK